MNELFRSDIALIAAGCIGGVTAVIHSVLLRRLMVRPLVSLAATERTMGRSIRELIGPLLDFSGFAWLCGGIALVIGGLWLGHEAQHALGVLVGSLFLYGAFGNLRATRGKHPGGYLMIAAVTLIAFASLSR